MDQYTLTKSRTIQWIIITLVLVGMTGAHWYFQTRAAVTMKTANKTGLVGYWNFDEGTGTTAYDKSGQNNTATLTSGPTWVDGKSGKAVNFDGVNDYISSSLTKTALGATFSFSFWMRPAGAQSTKGILQVASELTSQSPWILYQRTNPTTVRWYVNGDYRITQTVNDDTWYHISLTFDGTTWRAYKNGVADGTYTGVIGSLGATGTYFGNGYNGYFNGSLDEVRVYNRALSATEIANLYALGTATVNASTNALDTNGLVGQWSFDGKNTAWTSSVAGTTADTSGNGNTGTLTNMSQVTSPVPGKIGQAFNFFPNGTDTNSYANMGDPASGILDFGTADFSVGFWMKGAGFSSQGSSINIPLAKRSFNGTESGYGFSFGAGNTMNFIIYNGTTGYAATDTVATTNDNLWHHYVGVRSAGTMYLYRDGAVRGTNATVSGSCSTAYGFTVGTDGAINGQRNVNALIDEVRVYNRALSATEIANLYTLGTATVNASTNALNTNGLVGQWSFDGKDTTWTSSVAGSVTDTSGNGNTGTLTNMSRVTSPVPGKIGQAFNFDGVNDAVNAGTGSSLNITGQMTIAAWIYPTGWGGGSRGRIVDKDGNATAGYIFGIDNANTTSGLGFYVNSTAVGTESLFVANSITLNKWQHVAVTMNASKLVTIYVNGVSVGSSTLNVFPNTNANNFVIGGRTTDNGRNFSGTIDEVRVYNRALSAEEVNALYNAGR